MLFNNIRKYNIQIAWGGGGGGEREGNFFHHDPTSYMKEGNVLFNNTLNTFYLRLYGVIW